MNTFKTILITGARGFVGQYLHAALLKENYKVIALQTDIRDEVALDALFKSETIDCVFHLAGLSGQSPGREIYLTNVIGTQNLLDTVSKFRPECTVVLQGSSSIYGNSPNREEITEQTNLNPESHYGISKMALDRMGAFYFKEKGLKIIRTVPFNIIGPKQKPTTLCASVAEKISQIEAGIIPPVLELGDLTAYRDFVDVRDLTRALISIAKLGKYGEAYNICSNRETTASTAVEYLISQTKVKISFKTRSISGINVGYQLGSYRKLNELCGWKPEFSLEQSLKDILQELRNGLN